MKFWKHTLISAFAFVGLSSSVLYTACVKDSCEKLDCRNGSVCTDEFCVCPEGFQGTECEETIAFKFLGFYDGSTKCDELPVIIDSAAVAGFGTPNMITYRVFSQSFTVQNEFTATVGNEQNNQAQGRVDSLNLVTDIVDDGNKIIINMKWKKDDKVTSCTFTGTPRK